MDEAVSLRRLPAATRPVGADVICTTWLSLPTVNGIGDFTREHAERMVIG
jgi:hypothetical protein